MAILTGSSAATRAMVSETFWGAVSGIVINGCVFFIWTGGGGLVGTSCGRGMRAVSFIGLFEMVDGGGGGDFTTGGLFAGAAGLETGGVSLTGETGGVSLVGTSCGTGMRAVSFIGLFEMVDGGGGGDFATEGLFAGAAGLETGGAGGGGALGGNGLGAVEAAGPAGGPDGGRGGRLILTVSRDSLPALEPAGGCAGNAMRTVSFLGSFGSAMSYLARRS